MNTHHPIFVSRYQATIGAEIFQVVKLYLPPPLQTIKVRKEAKPLRV